MSAHDVLDVLSNAVAVTGTWPEPLPIDDKDEAREPYPRDAWPAGLRAACEEAERASQAPAGLVFTCALGPLSIACQGHVDVVRDGRLVGPCSIYALIACDSGERKSAVDSMFGVGLREFEARSELEARPALARFRADEAAWAAQFEGVKNEIRRNSRKGPPPAELIERLHRIEGDRPLPPIVPSVLLSDATPEGLGYALSRGYPSAGIVSAEGGQVLGGHGMGRDSIVRYLSLLNARWSDEPFTVTRRTSESYRVDGSRLSVLIQVQPPTLRRFLNDSGDLARGIGFLARFLFCAPESTQGTRMYRRQPGAWPALDAYQRRIVDLLSRPLPRDEAGRLAPKPLMLSEDGLSAWIEFYDAIESGLADGGELSALRDAGSKAAENCARIAALFHVYEHGTSGAIGRDHVEAAARIVSWHLAEMRRWFAVRVGGGDADLAIALEGVLRASPGFSRKRREIQNHGPSQFRNGVVLDRAAAYLADKRRIRVEDKGHGSTVYRLHPGLWGGDTQVAP